MRKAESTVRQIWTRSLRVSCAELGCKTHSLSLSLSRRIVYLFTYAGLRNFMRQQLQQIQNRCRIATQIYKNIF